MAPELPLDDAAQQRWHDYVYLRDNPAGAPSRALVSRRRLPGWLVVTRDTRTHEILKVEPARDVALAARHDSASPQAVLTRRTAPLAPCGEGSGVGVRDTARAHAAHPTPSPSPQGEGNPPCRLPTGGLIDRGRPLRVHLRRAHAIRAIAGDTLASALLANGVRLVGAVVQVSSPARHPHRRAGGAQRAGRVARRRAARAEHARDHGRAVRRARRREPEPLAVAALRSAGGQFAARAAAVGRLLLQDLHVAGVVLGEGVRAADPPRRRARARRRRSAIPTPTRRRSLLATCW